MIQMTPSLALTPREGLVKNFGPGRYE